MTDKTINAHKTINALKVLVKDTPLTDKLLSKPPFRYLHDLISEIIGRTGFGAGLFTGDETSSANVKEKEQKINWLKKAIKLTELASGTVINAKPAKIIAGLEPEETNKWLQILAKCTKVDTTEFVKSLGGVPPTPQVQTKPDFSEKINAEEPESVNKPSEINASPETQPPSVVPDEPNPALSTLDPPTRPETSAGVSNPISRNSSTSKEKDKTTLSSTKPATQQSKRPDSVAKSAVKPSKPGPSSTSMGSSKKDLKTTTGSVKDKNKPSSSKTSSLEPRTLKRVSSTQSGSTSSLPSTPNQVPAKPPAEASTSVQLPLAEQVPLVMMATNDTVPVVSAATDEIPNETPESLVDPETTDTIGDIPGREQVSNTAPKRERPNTARKAPPRARTVGDVVSDVKSPIGSIGKIGGALASASSKADLTMSATTIFPARLNEVDDSEEVEKMFVMVQDDEMKAESGSTVTGIVDVDMSEQHGGLVRKLMESKTSPEQENVRPGTAIRNTESPANRGGNDLAEQLQLRVQAVTRAAHPLGKTLDYLHEDMDAMTREYTRWRDEADRYRKELAKEREITQAQVQPLLDEMSKLDAAIELEHERISEAKARVLANEELLDHFVSNMVSLGT